MKPSVYLSVNDVEKNQNKQKSNYGKRVLKILFLCLVLVILGLNTAATGINSLTRCTNNYVFSLDMVKSNLTRVTKQIQESVFRNY
ncbi:MAG: hypothetical protein GX295_03525 [Syntrophomonadaceae bacterium]|nr:hypothetical protein [Syntrophomonadaceae bacterium]